MASKFSKSKSHNSKNRNSNSKASFSSSSSHNHQSQSQTHQSKDEQNNQKSLSLSQKLSTLNPNFCLQKFYKFSSYLIYFFTIIQVVLCPFTKVEESFNTQASHDILMHGQRLNKYDHVDYPGVVPRTFIGALFLSCVCYPFYLIGNLLFGVGSSNKFCLQIGIRIILGLINADGIRRLGECFLKGSVDQDGTNMEVQMTSRTRSKGRRPRDRNDSLDESNPNPSNQQLLLAILYNLISISQFHTNFYISRLLPNSFAFYLTIQAFIAMLDNKIEKFCAYGGMTIVIFRSELVLFYGPGLLFLLCKKCYDQNCSETLVRFLQPMVINFVFLCGVLKWLDYMFGHKHEVTFEMIGFIGCGAFLRFGEKNF